MRWEQTEYLLKGLYLGLLFLVALHDPSPGEIGLVWIITLATLMLCLGVAAYQKIREGYQARGRLLGFTTFLLLENPGMVYAGMLVGLTIATTSTFRDSRLKEHEHYTWLILGPVLAGLALGLLFWYLRIVRDRRLRQWLGLALAAALIGGAIAYVALASDPLGEEQRYKIGFLMLLGIPGFYVLTFASLVEESEVEIAAMCAALGVGLGFMGPRVSPIIALVVPLAIYYVYTRRILPELRVVKHVLRGISYGSIGNQRLALASLNRAVDLQPTHRLAQDHLWRLHRRLDIDQLKNDPETLALVNFELCLERVAWLLLQDKPTAEQIQEAERLLELVESQRPALAPQAAYWRAVALCHRRQPEEAAKYLESVLQTPAEDTPQRRAVLFQAWQLALVLHPEMKRRVGEAMLRQPGRRLEAIAAVERKLTQNSDDQAAWDLKRHLYADLTETDYESGVEKGQPAADFNHEYAQELGLALLEDSQRWQRGAEYLRIAARGLPTRAANLFLLIAKAHEKNGDEEGMWRNYRQAMWAGKAAGPKNLSEADRTSLFAVVKLLGESAMKGGRIDEALEAFKFYTQHEGAGMETWRTLAELFERNKDIWMALHCTEHALSYEGKDADLLARKDRYYFSLAPEDLKNRPDGVPKWFDIDYCLSKSRWALEKYQGDLDLLDWAGHLAELAQAARPSSISAKYLRARVHRLRGDIAQAVALFEDIRQHKPEKFSSEEERNAWFLTHRLLGEMYLDEKPDQAVLCFQEFRQSDHAGADTMYKLGLAYENLGDFPRAARCFENVLAYESHPLYFDARDGLERVKRTSNV